MRMPARGPHLLVVFLAVQCLAIALDAVVNLLAAVRELVLGAGARCGVNRFALTAVDGDECPREAGQLRAPPRALPADLPQRPQGVLPAGRTRLVSRSQLLS